MSNKIWGWEATVKVVILAAGLGKRLGSLTDALPKALLPVAGRPILDWQLGSLHRLGIPARDVIVVGGHQVEALRAALPPEATLLFNRDYASTNNIVSLYAARKETINEGFVLFNSDTLADFRVVKMVFEAGSLPTVVVDKSKPLSGEEMKVHVEGDRVVGFGKHLKNAEGEYIGIARFDAWSSVLLFKEIEAMIAQGLTGEWYEAAFDRLSRHIPIYPTYTQGWPWIEIDDANDLCRAEAMWAPVAMEL